MKKVRFYLGLLFIASATLLNNCSCSDVVGTLFVSEDEELKLGKEFNKQIQDSSNAKSKNYKIFVPKNANDSIFEKYILGIAKEVIADIPSRERPSYPFIATILDAPIENAFAVPGGYFYIYTGIIKAMEDESELAGVIGHEIAHVTKHHYRASMVNNFAQDAAIGVIVKIIFGDTAGDFTQLVTSAFSNLVSLKLDQGHETEADAFGTKYLALTERNPLGIASFFSRFKDPSLPWFSTHPAPSKRVEDVKAIVDGNSGYKKLSTDEKKNKTLFCQNAKLVATASPPTSVCPN